MLIDAKIQSDFNSLVVADDAATFNSAKTHVLADLESAMVEEQDPDIRQGMEALRAVISGWTYVDDISDPAPQEPPSQETLNSLSAYAGFVVPDLTDILGILLDIGMQVRREMREQKAQMQSQGLTLAADARDTQKAANASNYQKEMQSAAGEITGAAVGLATSGIGLGFAIKAAAASSKAQKLRGDGTDANPGLRKSEKELGDLENELEAAKADRGQAELLVGDAGTALKAATSKRATAARAQERDAQVAQGKRLDDEIGDLQKALETQKASKTKNLNEEARLENEIKDKQAERQKCSDKVDELDAEVPNAQKAYDDACDNFKTADDHVEDLRVKVTDKRAEVKAQQDEIDDLKSDADTYLRAVTALSQFSSGANGMSRGVANAIAARAGLDGANLQADAQYLQALMDLVGKNAQSSADFANDYSRWVDDVVSSYKQYLEGQNELGRHLAQAMS